MPIHKIAHYNFRLEPGLMDRVRDFYVSVVGMTQGPRPPFPSKGYWLYAGTLDLLHLTQEAGSDKRRTGIDLTLRAAAPWVTLPTR